MAVGESLFFLTVNEQALGGHGNKVEVKQHRKLENEAFQGSFAWHHGHATFDSLKGARG